MNVVIIEDEPLARKQLWNELRDLVPSAKLVAELDTVADSLDFLNSDPPPIDVAFCDIQLGDGLSFHIFNHYTPEFPLIFTTAYDEYALQAFSVNSIDYLLKPLKRTDLERALGKLRQRSPAPPVVDRAALQLLLRQLNARPATYKTSFLLNFRHRLVPVAVEDIHCVYINNEVVYALTSEEATYRMNDKLEDVAAQLDPAQFYRVNRQLILARGAVASLTPEVNGRYLLALRGGHDLGAKGVKLTVAKAKVAEFKEWLVS